ncbi:MAG: hypothetical protein ACREQM_00830 [Candidatus Dormibacteraceae bacterium]
MLSRVLGEPRLRAILQTFAARPAAALTVDEIASEHQLHRSVAFTHLEHLAAASLLLRGTRAGGRGRPARTYRYAGHAAEASHPTRQHRVLAGILATALAGRGPDGAAAAHEQGRTRGLALARGAEPVPSAIEVLGPIGGDYLLQGSIVQARNCVFREACESAREVVCGAHAGLIEGVLEITGAPSRVVPMGPDESGGCRFRLELPPSPGMAARRVG